MGWAAEAEALVFCFHYSPDEQSGSPRSAMAAQASPWGSWSPGRTRGTFSHDLHLPSLEIPLCL